jgi:recombination protein RecT
MSVTTIKQNPAAQLRATLTGMTPQFAAALPSHIKPEKFVRVVMTITQLNPELLRLDRQSLLAACLKCASDGLIPDGREAALVPFKGKVAYMPMFMGIQKRVRNSGEISSIQAHVIYENDEFVIQRGLEENIKHIPLFPGDRGKPIGAYAMARFKDGSDPMFEVMDIAAIEKVRAVSQTGRSSGSPWSSWWDEMARKSVFRRLAKWLPMDSEVDELLRRDDQAGAPTTTDAPTMDGEIATEPLSIGQDDFEAASEGASIEGNASDDDT